MALFHGQTREAGVPIRGKSTWLNAQKEDAWPAFSTTSKQASKQAANRQSRYGYVKVSRGGESQEIDAKTKHKQGQASSGVCTDNVR